MRTRRGTFLAAALWAAALLLAGPARAQEKSGEPARRAVTPKMRKAIAPSAVVVSPPVTIDIPDRCVASIRKACPEAFKGVREMNACLRRRPSPVSASCRKVVERRLRDAARSQPAGPVAVAAPKPARRPSVGAPPLSGREARKDAKPATDKQARAAVIRDCKADAQEFCSDLTKSDDADVVGCLKAYANQASRPCAAALDALTSFEGD